MRIRGSLIVLTGVLALAAPAEAFERARIDFDTVTSITSLMTDPERGNGESAEQQRIVVIGTGSLEFDKSVPELANRKDLRIRLNMPRGVSAKRRNGRNVDLLSQAENGHAAVCLSFAMRVLTNSEQFDLRIASQASGIASGHFKRTRDAAGREILVIRIDEDSFEDVTCAIVKNKD